MSVINPVYGKLKMISRLEGANLSKSAWLKDLALLSELSRNLNKNSGEQGLMEQVIRAIISIVEFPTN